MIEVRKLDKSENVQTKSLYEAVFPADKGEFATYYYEHVATRNEIYVAEETKQKGEDGSPAKLGMLHLNPVNVSIYGQRQDLSYIVAVGTHKDFRHQGIMSKLLKESLNDLSEKKDPFTFLMAIDPAIYEPFGFRKAWDWKWEEEICDERGGGFAREAWLCDDIYITELCRRVNKVLAERYDLFVYRTLKYYRELDYQQRASGGKLMVIFNDQSKPLSAMCLEKEQFPPMMMRITDFASYISLIHTSEEDHFRWRVTDPIIEANNGVFDITISKNGCSAVKVDESTAEDSAAHEFVPVDEPVDVKIEDVPMLLGIDDPLRRTGIWEVV